MSDEPIDLDAIRQQMDDAEQPGNPIIGVRLPIVRALCDEIERLRGQSREWRLRGNKLLRERDAALARIAAARIIAQNLQHSAPGSMQAQRHVDELVRALTEGTE